MCQFLRNGGLAGTRGVISAIVDSEDCPLCATVGLYPFNEEDIPANNPWAEYVATRSFFHTVARAIDHSDQCFISSEAMAKPWCEFYLNGGRLAMSYVLSGMVYACPPC